jgi:hypothetical protein
MPVKASSGAALNDIRIGDKLNVNNIITAPELEVLNWRYSEKKRNDRASNIKRVTMSKEDDVELPEWPAQRCFTVHHRFWCVTLPDLPNQFCILQVASNPDERTGEALEADTQASAALADYAHKFNTQQANESQHDPPPAIKVAAPIGCEVIDSDLNAMFSKGDMVVLYMLPRTLNIEKFIFNGDTIYMDLAQAFFHFVTLASGGRDLAFDLQGIQEDSGDVILVDPALLKASGKKDETPVCGPLMGSPAGLEWGHFQALHSRCSPLCKVFDPHRTVRIGRRLSCGC